MKKKDLEKLKGILEDEHRRILHHLEALSSSAELGAEEAGSGDSADIASAEMNKASIQKIGKREAFLLRKIEHALQKFTDGTYGECESCGEEIGVPRLLARPVAQLCIDCKTEQEKMERKFSSREEVEEDDEEGGLEETEEA